MSADLYAALEAAKLTLLINMPMAHENGMTVVFCAPTSDNPLTIRARLERAGWMMVRFNAHFVDEDGVVHRSPVRHRVTLLRLPESEKVE